MRKLTCSMFCPPKNVIHACQTGIKEIETDLRAIIFNAKPATCLAMLPGELRNSIFWDLKEEVP